MRRLAEICCLSSVPLHLFHTRAAVAQLGERQTEDLKVPGSIPGGGILFFVSVVVHSTIPSSKTNVSVAQWITRPPPKGKIAGSNPARDVYFFQII